MNMWTTKCDAPVFVYVMSSEHAGVKVGVAKSPDVRRRQIQCKKTGKVQIEYLVRCGGAGWAATVERAAHAFLNETQIEFEWFNVSVGEAIDALNRAAERRWSVSYWPCRRGEKRRVRAIRDLTENAKA